MNRRAGQGVLLLVLVAMLGAGCTKRVKEIQRVPPPPEKARIQAAIDSYKKHKQSGADTAPLAELQNSLRMLAKTWGSYEYAKKELAKAAVTITEIRTIAAVDIQISETKRQDAEARADKYRRHFWIAVAVGAAAALVGFGVGAIAF